MKHFVFMLMIGFFLPVHPVCAEMYRYQDISGVVRFTDNLSDVPENQRPRASIYENTSAPAEPSAAQEPSGRKETDDPSRKLSESLAGDLDTDIPPTEENSNAPSRIDELLKMKTALDAEYAQLMKESLSLSEERKTISGNNAVKAHNQKVIDLNARVEAYEKRRAAFQKEADAFDASLKKRLAQPPQPLQTPSP
jgi:hypothetical protein